RAGGILSETPPDCGPPLVPQIVPILNSTVAEAARPCVHQSLTFGPCPQMWIDERRMNGEPLVDAMKAEDAGCLQVTPRIQIAMLAERPLRNEAAGDSPDTRVLGPAAHDGFHNQPFPDHEWRGIRALGIPLQVFRDQRADCDCR